MYKCEECGCIYEEPELISESGCYEDDYGVSGMFSNLNYYSREYEACPNCGYYHECNFEVDEDEIQE